MAVVERALAPADLAEPDLVEPRRNRIDAAVARKVWASAWPKLLAVAIVLLGWQIVVWTHWRPEYVLPGPRAVLGRFFSSLGEGATWKALFTTLRRALTGYSLAIVVGGVIGLAVARVKVLRAAIGSLVTGLQTMPSIVWFPLAIVLFKLSESAILFVVVIGAAPSVANGVVAGVDHVPPLYLRAGRVLGARGLGTFRHVVVPAAMPELVGGLKQAWAFSWRSLMAGELLQIIANQPSLGTRLEFDRQFADYTGLLADMLLVLCVGIVIDALVFGTVERGIRRRRGLGVA